MQTSSFFHYEGPGRISIARYAPKHVRGVLSYPALAPGSWFKQLKDFESYRKRYHETILQPLNAEDVYQALHRLSGEHEPVLLCWEHLTKPGDWCHRRIVAEWFENALGVHVPERPRPIKDNPQGSLF